MTITRVDDYSRSVTDYKIGTLKRFFYLIVRSNNSESNLSDEDVQSFFRSGVNTGSDYIFILIDVSNDGRLSGDLSKRPGGDEFYARINTSCPTFLITDRPIQQVANFDEIRIHPIKDYRNDVQILYNEMGIDNPTRRAAFIGFLRRANRYANLRPNIFGLGLNINEMIADWVDGLERASP